MAKRKEPFNPFYPVLVLAGIVFFITACAYGVMAFRDVRGDPTQAATPNSLMLLMQNHGGKLLAAELLVLALSSFAAMGIDQYRSNRVARCSTVDEPQPDLGGDTNAASASANLPRHSSGSA